MDIFIGQLIGFGLIAFLFWKYVLPPLRRAVRSQQDAIADQVAESEAAKQRVIDAQQAQARAKERAAAEAKEFHEEALGDAESIKEDLRATTDREIKRIGEQGRAQASLTRANLVRGLRSDLGLSAVDGAGKLVREHLSNPAAQSQSIDRAIGELDSMAASTPSEVPASASLVGLRSMRAGSRDAAHAVAERFDRDAADLDTAALTTASQELTQVIELLDTNPVLRKRLTDEDDQPEAKERLVRTLFGGKVSPIVVDVVATAANQRWSTPSDFLAALKRQNALIDLTAADRDGSIEQVEDELFRVSRLLEANPELASLLSDHTHPADKRVGLLRGLVGDQVGPITWNLLSQTILLLRGQSVEVAVDQLAALAAARRGESVAHVVSAAPLTNDQVERLSSVLGSIYGRTVSVQTEVDPELLGGLRIGIGDEVIEADVATQLAKAAESLPN